jgi:hypothetical protein
MRLVRPIGSAALFVAPAIALGLALSACAARAYPPTVGGYATVYADDAPANISSYPHTEYEGGTAYYVNDRWYYGTPRGWVVLRGEPRELHQYRVSRRPTVPVAPPVYRREEPRQSAPPAQYGYPPPAVRVR